MSRFGHHELKIWPEYFEPVRAFDKRFEIRKDDRDYQVGDTLLLKEWDPTTTQFTGRHQRVRVTYIYRGPLAAEGHCVMSIKKLPAIGGQ